jgi:hypothetical protein
MKCELNLCFPKQGNDAKTLVQISEGETLYEARELTLRSPDRCVPSEVSTQDRAVETTRRALSTEPHKRATNHDPTYISTSTKHTTTPTEPHHEQLLFPLLRLEFQRPTKHAVQHAATRASVAIALAKRLAIQW